MKPDDLLSRPKPGRCPPSISQYSGLTIYLSLMNGYIVEIDTSMITVTAGGKKSTRSEAAYVTWQLPLPM